MNLLYTKDNADALEDWAVATNVFELMCGLSCTNRFSMNVSFLRDREKVYAAHLFQRLTTRLETAPPPTTTTDDKNEKLEKDMTSLDIKKDANNDENSENTNTHNTQDTTATAAKKDKTKSKKKKNKNSMSVGMTLPDKVGLGDNNEYPMMIPGWEMLGPAATGGKKKKKDKKKDQSKKKKNKKVKKEKLDPHLKLSFTQENLSMILQKFKLE